jgi:hypothetical protein
LAVEAIVSLLFSILPLPEKITLTMDRTNWQFGRKDINFLTLAFVYNGMSIPFLWKLLDHQGNSHTKARISLMALALKFLDSTRVICLLADREFIGEDWFHWLSKQQIPFCIRLKANTQVQHKNGGYVAISNLCRPLKPSESIEITTKVWGLKTQVTAMKQVNGELLILAKTADIAIETLALYKNRWTIECLFKALKTQGFNLEGTQIKHEERLSKLMALCAIAFAWSVKIGEIKAELKPIKIKKHARPLFSLFTYGLQTLKAIFCKMQDFSQVVQLIALTFSNDKPNPQLKLLTVVY